MSDWPRIPPEWRGHTWSRLVTERGEDGKLRNRMVESRFPPSQIGNPAEQVDAFYDFRAYHGLMSHQEHPEDRCDVHHRFLSKREFEAGQCYWCRPDLAPDYKPTTERMTS